MSIRVEIPIQLREHTGGERYVTVTGGTVEQAIANLIEQAPSIGPKLYTDAGQLRGFINVFVNDEDIRFLDEMQTPVKDADIVLLQPSVSGG